MNSYMNLNCSFHSLMKRVYQIPLFVLLCVFATVTVHGQYNSGSTGADGAMDFSINRPDCPIAQTQCTVQLPPSGIFNITTMFVPSNKTIYFARNALNTPVVILAQGDVRIEGAIDIRGGSGNAAQFAQPSIGGLGGPGGFDGGASGYTFIGFFQGFAGNGPGGGAAGGNPTNDTPFVCGGGGGFLTAGSNASTGGIQGGLAYGNVSLTPLIGGSGGGGGSSQNAGSRGGGGGGGGGAILIASSGAIRFRTDGGNAFIYALGGSGQGVLTAGGAGAGGAIRLAANLITGMVNFNVRGDLNSGSNPCISGAGSSGRIRLEAFSYVGFTPSFTSNAPQSQFLSLVQNPQPPFPAGVPSITITSVAGQNVPNPPSNSPHGAVDLQIPRTVTNPVNVALSASNIPTGTVIKVTTQPNAGTRTTVDSTPLAGTTAASTATASISLLDGVSLITATVIFFPPPSLAGIVPSSIGGEKVEKIEVSSTLGGGSEVIYITKSGKRIKESEVNKEKR